MSSAPDHPASATATARAIPTAGATARTATPAAPRAARRAPAAPTDDALVRRAHRWGPVAALVLAALALGAAFAAEPLGWWGGDVHQWLPPLSAHFVPTAGPALPVVVAVGALVAWRGPALAAALAWRPLLAATWVTGAAWGFGLALLRGASGVTSPLANPDEVLADVPRVHSAAQVVRVYTSHILSDHPHHWATHDSGSPPLPLLAYAGLARLGLGGPGRGGVVTALVASTGVLAVMVALRALGEERRARAAAPLLALTPLVTWTVVSVDGVIMAVTAWGVALLALAARPGLGRRHWLPLALAAGLAFAAGVFCSYGMVLIGPVALAVLVAARSWRPVLPALAALAAVAAAFAAAGFWWLDGERLVVVRYYQGKGALRPYSYWVWADLAVAAVAVGPAVVAGLGELTQRALEGAVARRRRTGHPWRTGQPGRTGRLVASAAAALAGVPPTAWLATGALVAIGASTSSGLSKSEVERIWLPFLLWLVPAATWLPKPRAWAAASGAWGVLLGSLYLTTW